VAALQERIRRALAEDGPPGADVGLSVHTIEDIAAWATEFHYQHRGEPDPDGRLATALRERLCNKYDVLPEHIETEAARVMDRVFGC
jgi:hypothetical protein